MHFVHIDRKQLCFKKPYMTAKIIFYRILIQEVSSPVMEIQLKTSMTPPGQRPKIKLNALSHITANI